MTTATDEAQPLTDDEIARALQEEDQTTGVDPEAPWGRFKNGNPRKNPDGERRARGPRPPRARKPSTGRKQAPRRPDYETVIAGLLQAITLPLIAVSPLDAVTMIEYGPEMAKAGAYAADADAGFAAKLDKLGTIGPFALMFTVGAKILTQVLTNHAVIPPILGAVPRERMAERARALFAQMRGGSAHDAPAV